MYTFPSMKEELPSGEIVRELRNRELIHKKESDSKDKWKSLNTRQKRRHIALPVLTLSLLSHRVLQLGFWGHFITLQFTRIRSKNMKIGKGAINGQVFTHWLCRVTEGKSWSLLKDFQIRELQCVETLRYGVTWNEDDLSLFSSRNYPSLLFTSNPALFGKALQ